MKSFLLQIKVKEEKLDTAVEALAGFEAQGRRDVGCITFAWMQHEKEPLRFTLFEQWESQQALDAHLSPRLIEEWNAFASCLEEAPESIALRPISAVQAPLTEEEIRSTVEKWFDLLSEHAPVDELLPYLNPKGIQMQFPEQTIATLAEFRGWYDRVGTLYRDQSHRLESLHLTRDDQDVDIDLVVTWQATQSVDGSPLVIRASQRWRIGRSLVTAMPVIKRYEVVRFDPIAPL